MSCLPGAIRGQAICAGPSPCITSKLRALFLRQSPRLALVEIFAALKTDPGRDDWLAGDTIPQCLSRVSSHTLAAWNARKTTAPRPLLISPACCKFWNSFAEQPLPALEGGVEREALCQRSCPPRPAVCAMRDLLEDVEDGRRALRQCRSLQEITSRLSIRGIGGIHPADKWNSCQPGVVELWSRACERSWNVRILAPPRHSPLPDSHASDRRHRR